VFLGSMPVQKKSSLFWRWHLADCYLKTASTTEAEKTAALLQSASAGNGIKSDEFYNELKVILGENSASSVWRFLRSNGLIAVEIFHQ